MILPKDEECQRVMAELDGCPDCTAWELEFIKSNINRTIFTSAQKEVVAKLLQKYDI